MQTAIAEIRISHRTFRNLSNAKRTTQKATTSQMISHPFQIEASRCRTENLVTLTSEGIVLHCQA
ncbi:hypothetical protein, partial [Salmonella enterica]|uniref:hypothetical protein n=1 Tax=Salmonella enterica TaxID=28901 RepID=UPI0020C2567E